MGGGRAHLKLGRSEERIKCPPVWKNFTVFGAETGVEDRAAHSGKEQRCGGAVLEEWLQLQQPSRAHWALAH